MAFSWKDILESAAKMILGASLGNLGMGSVVIRNAKGSAKASDVLKGAVLTYPGLTQKFNYPILYSPSDMPNMNASIDRNLQQRYPLAQTLEEHNTAVREGREKDVESWWPTTDTKPRADFHPSSSAVSGVHIEPDNTISIQFGGKGKWYSYNGGRNPRESSEIAKELLTAPSIGRALPRNGKYAHNGKSDRKGHPDGNIGWWGRQHFNPNFVK